MERRAVMLYDEEGNAHTEPPLLPEEQHLMYIVKDYRRMYMENGHLYGRNKRLRESLKRVNAHQYAQSRIIIEQKQMMGRLMGILRKHGIPVPRDISEFKPLKY